MGISVHMLQITVSNNWREVMFWTCFCSSCLSICHTFSIILRSGLRAGHSMHCKSVSSIYSFITCVWGHYHLETHNCHLGNYCNIGPSKVINDFNIFLGINITVISCQSTHTFIDDAAPDHQTYTNTTTWIQAWWSSFFAGSSPNKYMVVHSQFDLTFIIIYSPSSRNHLQFCAYSIYNMPAIFWHCSRKFWCFLFTTHLWYFVSNKFLWIVRSDLYRSSPILIENISNFPEWTFSVRFYNLIKFSSVPGVNKDGLPDLSLFSTVPRCLKRFKTLYIVGSRCPVSHAIAGLSVPLCAKQQLHSFETKTDEHVFVQSQKRWKL